MKQALIAIGILAVLGVAYWLISPLFIDVEVNEALAPDVEQAIDQLAADVEPNMRDDFKAEMADMPQEEMVNEDMPEGDATEASAGIEEKEQPAPDSEAPRVVAAGSFVDVAHEGTGMVKLIDLGGETGAVVRFENLDVLNGPDLRVLLSKNTDISSSAELGEYIELGKLKGNMGNQNYEVPAGVDVSAYKSVVIYCKPFSVVFNVAALQ